MQELRTAPNFVEYETLKDGGAIAAVLERSELETIRDAGEPAGLWFDLAHERDEEAARLTIELTPADLEELLRSPGEQIVVTVDGDAVAGLFEEADVEAHGLKSAIALAVATAAIGAPSALAATPQVSSAASPQVTAQVSGQVTTQVSNQAVPQVASLASKAQVRAQITKPQITKSLVVKAGGVKLLKTLAR